MEHLVCYRRVKMDEKSSDSIVPTRTFTKETSAHESSKFKVKRIRGEHETDLVIPGYILVTLARQSVYCIEALLGCSQISMRKKWSQGVPRGNNSLRKQSGWLNLVLTKLLVHKSIPIESTCSSSRTPGFAEDGRG